MREYDPWVCALMAEANRKAALQEVAEAKLAREAVDRQATGPSEVGAHPERRYFQDLVSQCTAYSRRLFHRRESVPPWSSWVWPG